jgi:hypothetical protein
MLKQYTTALLIALVLVFSSAVAAENKAQTKEDKDKLPSTEVRSTLDAVRNELIKVHLADGFKLCGEELHQLSFCKPLHSKLGTFLDPRRGMNGGYQTERVFTLSGGARNLMTRNLMNRNR